MLDKIGITEKTWDFLWRDCFLYNIMTSAVFVLCGVHQRFPSYCWYKRSTGKTERDVTMICNTVSITFCCRNAHRAENETHRHWESESPHCWIIREVWGPDQLLPNFFTWTLHLLTTSCDQHLETEWLNSENLFSSCFCLTRTNSLLHPGGFWGYWVRGFPVWSSIRSCCAAAVSPWLWSPLTQVSVLLAHINTDSTF